MQVLIIITAKYFILFFKVAFDNIITQEEEYTVTISTELNGRTVTQMVEKFPMGQQDDPLGAKYLVSFSSSSLKSREKYISFTPAPLLMRIHLVQYPTSARYENYSNTHLVRAIIHLVRIFELSE